MLSLFNCQSANNLVAKYQYLLYPDSTNSKAFEKMSQSYL